MYSVTLYVLVNVYSFRKHHEKVRHRLILLLAWESIQIKSQLGDPLWNQKVRGPIKWQWGPNKWAWALEILWYKALEFICYMSYVAHLNIYLWENQFHLL